MRQIKHHILFLIGFLIPAMVFTQGIEITKSSTIETNGISDIKVDEIIATLQSTMNEYAEAAILMDTDENKVNSHSIKRFRKLFTDDAEIEKDYKQNIRELINHKDYVLDVYNLMPLQGFRFEIEKIELIKIVADSDGYYIPTLKVEKIRYNSLNADGDIVLIEAGESFTQLFKFDIKQDDMNYVLIKSIKDGDDGEDNKGPADNYTRFISISAGGHLPNYSATTSSYWQQAHDTSKLDIARAVGYSIGFELMSDRILSGPKASNRPLALSLGVRYQFSRLNSNLGNFNLEDFEALAEQDLTGAENRYIRIVESVNVEEKTKMHTIQIPVGVAFRISNKQRLSFYTHLRFIPTLGIGASSETTGTGNYDGVLIVEDEDSPNYGEISEMRILKIQAVMPGLIDNDGGFAAYRVGRNQAITHDTKPELVSFTYAIQISPTVYYSLSDDNPGWGVLFGLDATYSPKSILKHSIIDSVDGEPFRFNDSAFNGSIHNYYTEKIADFNLGLRIGFFQKLSIEPKYTVK